MVYNKIDGTRCCISHTFLTRQKYLNLMTGDFFIYREGSYDKGKTCAEN